MQVDMGRKWEQIEKQVHAATNHGVTGHEAKCGKEPNTWPHYTYNGGCITSIHLSKEMAPYPQYAGKSDTNKHM